MAKGSTDAHAPLPAPNMGPLQATQSVLVPHQPATGRAPSYNLAVRSSCIQGYKKWPNFLKFSENRRNRAGPNLKTAENIVRCFKILEKDKKHQNICKKTRSNTKVIGEEIFVKPGHLGW
jgi:hypothetical protein